MKSFNRFLTIFVVVVSPTVAEEERLCSGRYVASGDITQIDIANSDVTVNTLHETNGELRFEGVGSFDDDSLDLVVKVTGGEYTKISEAWEAKNKDASKNGKNGGFANINLQTVEREAYSGRGDFQICFVKSGTQDRVTLDAFHFSVSDIDQRGEGDDMIQEQLLMDVSQAESFQMWPNMRSSEVTVSCADTDSVLPCPADVRTVFHSSVKGSGTDRPTNPSDMTNDQLKRTVEFTFINTDCFEFSYDHYCPADRDEDDDTSCKFYSGGNFLFSGVPSVTGVETVHVGDGHLLQDILQGECFF